MQGAKRLKIAFVAGLAAMLTAVLGAAQAEAITVKVYLCGDTSCSSVSQIGTTKTGSPVPIAGSYGNLTISNVSSTATANVAVAQTSSVKNLKLSNAKIKASVAGTYLIRMLSDEAYSPQPGNRNYTNSVTINGAWICPTLVCDFRANTIKEILYANVGNATYQTSVDKPTAAPTILVTYNVDNKSFSRTLNTASEDIYLPSAGLTCTDPSTGQSITSCGKNRHQKDLIIKFSAANQEVNMGESSIGVSGESEVSQGSRAQVNQFIFCGETGAKFQFGTTGVEKNYIVFPHSPLATEPSRPQSQPPTVPVQFDPFLNPIPVDSDRLVSVVSDTDTSNDRQFDLFLPCQPITFAEITNLTAAFPTNAFLIDNTQSDACKGTVRWVLSLVDKKGVTETVEVLYGDPEQGFNACQFSTNILAAGGARFLVDGKLQTRNQINALNSSFVTAIKFLVDGGEAVDDVPIDITVQLTSLRVNDDVVVLTTSSAAPVAFCAPTGPFHGFSIRVTKLDANMQPVESKEITQERVSTTGCKISANAVTATDFPSGGGLFKVEVLNNNTALSNAGFITFAP